MAIGNTIREFKRINLLLAFGLTILLNSFSLLLGMASFESFLALETMIALLGVTFYEISTRYKKKEGLKYLKDNAFDKVASATEKAGSIILLIFILFMAPTALIITGIALSFSKKGIEDIIIMAITYGLLFAGRKYIKKEKIINLEGIAKWSLPQIKINEDSFDINLKMSKRTGEPLKEIKIKFDEIKNFKEMKTREAQAFVSYKLWQRADWKIKAMNEYYKYTRGEIERPSIFLQYFIGGKPPTIWLLFLGTTILIEGKDLLYFFTLRKKQAKELQEAYDRYKQKKGN